MAIWVNAYSGRSSKYCIQLFYILALAREKERNVACLNIGHMKCSVAARSLLLPPLLFHLLLSFFLSRVLGFSTWTNSFPFELAFIRKGSCSAISSHCNILHVGRMLCKYTHTHTCTYRYIIKSPGFCQKFNLIFWAFEIPFGFFMCASVFTSASIVYFLRLLVLCRDLHAQKHFVYI